jgi:hypothetical protein
MPEVELKAPRASDKATTRKVSTRAVPGSTCHPDKTVLGEHRLEYCAASSERFFRRTHLRTDAYNYEFCPDIFLLRQERYGG